MDHIVDSVIRSERASDHAGAGPHDQPKCLVLSSPKAEPKVSSASWFVAPTGQVSNPVRHLHWTNEPARTRVTVVPSKHYRVFEDGRSFRASRELRLDISHLDISRLSANEITHLLSWACSVAPPSVQSRIDERLAMLAQIEAGWLEGEGEKTTAEAIATARAILHTIAERAPDLERLGIFPEEDGGIGLQWHLPLGMLLLTIAPGGGLHEVWMGDDLRARGGAEFVAAAGVVSEQFARRLGAWLASLPQP